MKWSKSYFIFLALLQLPFSCNQKNEEKKQIEDKIIMEYKQKFSDKKYLFLQLIKKLDDESLNAVELGVVKNRDQMEKSIKRCLINLDIETVYSFRWSCNRKIQYDFDCNPIRDKFHYYYNTCDTVATQIGYYLKDDKIERWGLGDNWGLWKLLIDRPVDKKQ